MKIIVPTEINDTGFVSSDVPEADYAEFSMGTNYGAGDTVIDSTGVEILTLDVAPATAWIPGRLITGQSSGETCYVVEKLTSLTYTVRERTGAFTLGEIIGVTGVGAELADQGAAHPTITPATEKVHKIYEALSASGMEIITLDVAPSTPWLPPWTITGQTSGKTCVIVQYLTPLTYLVKERSGAFTLGEVVGVTGTPSLLADQGAANPVFSTAVNVAHYPPTDLLRSTPLWWKEISATNRWKPFDGKIGSQAEQSESISYSLTPGMIESIAFLNLDASSIKITITDPSEGVVYDETIDLVMTDSRGISLIYDWYSYFFGTAPKTTDVVKLDLPPYPSATLDIEISNPGLTAKVGEIVVGINADLGMRKHGTGLSISDYSTKAADEYGSYTIAERSYAKRLTVSLHVDNLYLDEVYRILALYRATAVVWVASEDYAAMIVFGFYKNFEIVVQYDTWSDCSIEIEGLT
jgi:hypothetical protein